MLPERRSPLPLRYGSNLPESKPRPDEQAQKAEFAISALEKRIAACREGIERIRQQERARRFTGGSPEVKVTTSSELWGEYSKLF